MTPPIPLREMVALFFFSFFFSFRKQRKVTLIDMSPFLLTTICQYIDTFARPSLFLLLVTPKCVTIPSTVACRISFFFGFTFLRVSFTVFFVEFFLYSPVRSEFYSPGGSFPLFSYLSTIASRVPFIVVLNLFLFGPPPPAPKTLSFSFWLNYG